MLGLGYFGKNYVRLLRGIRGVELAAVASRTEETLARFKGVIPRSAIATTNASLILKNPGIDCVVIATPPETHFMFAKKALECGKHVLVEKPMVTSLGAAQQLRAAVKKSMSTFMVGHQYVYNDYVSYLHDGIRKGLVGNVEYVVGEHLCFPARNDIGCLWDAGPHQLSMLHYLFNPGRIVKVVGKSVSISEAKGVPDDFTAATVTFESGLIATIVMAWFAPKKTRKLTIVGDRAMAVFDDVEAKKLKLFPSQAAPAVAAREPLLNEVEHFIRCIRTGEKPLTGIDSSYEIIEWLDKISRSVKKK